MGKTTRWIRSLFRPKKNPKSSTGSGSLRQYKLHGSSTTILLDSSHPEPLDANNHAIAVAAATAAVAEAALAAAHAAAEVARRALRALKALVKLQALVRGRIVRKQSADMLRRMQALERVQARVCATRASISASPRSSTRSSNSHTQPKSKSAKGAFIDRRLNGLNWLENWMEDTSRSSKQCRADDERSDNILEVDTWKPRLHPSPSNTSTHGSPWNPASRHLSREALPLGSMIHREAESTVSTADNTPRVPSPASKPGSSHKRSPFTECSRSVFGDYPSYPNYMANTESSRAKLRSHSAPRQRIPFEKSGSTRRRWDCSDTVSERGFRS